MKRDALNLFHVHLEEFFFQLRQKFPNAQYNYKRHPVEVIDENHDEFGYVRLPLHHLVDENLKILERRALTLYLTIESGHAAICVMDGLNNVYHTTFSAYMSRKKQGVSQIKYLNKKGKSRAGSRVRLAKTIEFFESINTSLTNLFTEYDVNRIAFDCSTTLIPYLYQSKVPCPFEKKDSRLYKIPLHIPQSNYTHLDKAIKKLRAPMLFFDPQYDDELKRLVENSTTN